MPNMHNSKLLSVFYLIVVIVIIVHSYSRLDKPDSQKTDRFIRDDKRVIKQLSYFKNKRSHSNHKRINIDSPRFHDKLRFKRNKEKISNNAEVHGVIRIEKEHEDSDGRFGGKNASRVQDTHSVENTDISLVINRRLVDTSKQPYVGNTLFLYIGRVTVKKRTRRRVYHWWNKTLYRFMELCYWPVENGEHVIYRIAESMYDPYLGVAVGSLFPIKPYKSYGEEDPPRGIREILHLFREFNDTESIEYQLQMRDSVMSMTNTSILSFTAIFNFNMEGATRRIAIQFDCTVYIDGVENLISPYYESSPFDVVTDINIFYAISYLESPTNTSMLMSLASMKCAKVCSVKSCSESGYFEKIENASIDEQCEFKMLRNISSNTMMVLRSLTSSMYIVLRIFRIFDPATFFHEDSITIVVQGEYWKSGNVYYAMFGEITSLSCDVKHASQVESFRWSYRAKGTMTSIDMLTTRKWYTEGVFLNDGFYECHVTYIYDTCSIIPRIKTMSSRIYLKTVSRPKLKKSRGYFKVRHVDYYHGGDTVNMTCSIKTLPTIELFQIVWYYGQQKIAIAEDGAVTKLAAPHEKRIDVNFTRTRKAVRNIYESDLILKNVSCKTDSLPFYCAFSYTVTDIHGSTIRLMSDKARVNFVIHDIPVSLKIEPDVESFRDRENDYFTCYGNFYTLCRVRLSYINPKNETVRSFIRARGFRSHDTDTCFDYGSYSGYYDCNMDIPYAIHLERSSYCDVICPGYDVSRHRTVSPVIYVVPYRGLTVTVNQTKFSYHAGRDNVYFYQSEYGETINIRYSFESVKVPVSVKWSFFQLDSNSRSQQGPTDSNWSFIVSNETMGYYHVNVKTTNYISTLGSRKETTLTLIVSTTLPITLPITTPTLNRSRYSSNESSWSSSTFYTLRQRTFKHLPTLIISPTPFTTLYHTKIPTTQTAELKREVKFNVLSLVAIALLSTLLVFSFVVTTIAVYRSLLDRRESNRNLRSMTNNRRRASNRRHERAENCNI